MNKIKMILAFVTVVIFAGAVNAAESKIGYIDLEKAIQETAAGKKAKKDLEAESKTKTEQFKKKDADLKKMVEDLDKKRAVLSKDALEKKENEVRGEMAKFQKEVNETQLGLQKRERELLQPILEKMQDTIEKVATSGGYTVILQKSDQLPVVLWASKQIDLTDEVVKAFEKSK